MLVIIELLETRFGSCIFGPNQWRSDFDHMLVIKRASGHGRQEWERGYLVKIGSCLQGGVDSYLGSSTSRLHGWCMLRCLLVDEGCC